MITAIKDMSDVQFVILSVVAVGIMSIIYYIIWKKTVPKDRPRWSHGEPDARTIGELKQDTKSFHKY
jgi:hypothetical protein